ncbi:leucine-rich repeat protein 9 [Plasmodium falciparum IGH-CR14]|uniref:Leucine-rich repeat protein 9 n=1 Tax=Plasmodium falciparum IGH-CR14 TaxID=580059 RepID=A0A0L1I9Z1_PLAFA|nr:leucine-rich repeat protein 9 [Plasmodium falciparum IGH-CR14]
MRISKHLFSIGRKQYKSCRKSKKKKIFSPFDCFVNTNFKIFKKKWLKFIKKNKSYNKGEYVSRCYSNIDGNIEENIEIERRKENEKQSNDILFDEMHKKKKEKKNRMLKDNHHYHYHHHNNNNFTNFNSRFNQIIIYNVILKNDIINDIYLEVLFFDLDALSNVILNNSYGCMMINYLQIFYKKLKRVHIKNKLINLYTSKINNIYSNLLFYHTYKNKKNFLLHTKKKKKKAYIQLIKDDKIINDKNIHVNMNIIHMKEKYIHNYLFKIMNNMFINRFIYLYNKKEKKKNFGHIKENVNKMNVCRTPLKSNIISYFNFKNKFLKKNFIINKRYKYAFTGLRSQFFNKLKSYKEKNNNINSINSINNVYNIYNIYNINNIYNNHLSNNPVDKHIYNSKIHAYQNIFSNFNLLKLNHIFFKLNHKNKEECKEILNINYDMFIHTFINKRKGKKKYFLLFIKYYKEIFNTNDIFIIDRENVKKNFFFFFYHTLIGGPTFFFFNKEKEKGSITCNIPKKQNKQKKKMIIKKRLSYILYNKTNYPRNISFFFGKRKNNKIINLITRNRRKPYFINLNNNELKYNSTDNYIIFFLYDLIFNHNFDIYKYMYTNLEREEEEEEKHTHNSFICTFNKNKNKNKIKQNPPSPRQEFLQIKMNQENSNVNDKDTPSFIFYEKTYEGDDTCFFNIIISFKKLKIYNEKDFEEVINLNAEHILKDIVKIEEGLQRNIYNTEIIKKRNNKKRNKKKEVFDIDINNEMDNENMNDINYNPNKYDNCDDLYKNYKERFDILINELNDSNIKSYTLKEKSEGEEEKKKLCVMWELDLSYNYFKEISIDNILSIMISKNIIPHKNILQLNNLRTLNLRKNNLIYFPYISNFVLDGLVNIHISHNYINGCNNYIDKIDNMTYISKNLCEEDIKNKINNINFNNEGTWNKIIPNLKNIYVQNNYLQSFFSLKYLINKHKNIKYINISFNKINFLTDLFILKNVEHINLSYNTFMNVESNMTSHGITKDINNNMDEKNDIYHNNINKNETTQQDEEITINVDHTIEQTSTHFCIEGQENKNMLISDSTYKNQHDNDNNNVHNKDNNNEIIFHNLLLNLKFFFPSLKNLNIKYTEVYQKFKLYIKKEDYKYEQNYFIDFK